ncbi:MAG: TolC family protein [Treponema sp.]|nr:TolC family protein [Treponema sp.]
MSRVLRAFLPIVAIFCASLAANAQTPPSPETPLHITPKDAVDMVIRNNLSLETARISLGIQKRRADLVWNQFLPTVGVDGTASRANQPNTTPGMTIPLPAPFPPIETPSRTLPQWNLTGRFSANLDFSFALIQGIAAIRNEYLGGIVTFEKAQLKIEQGVLKMYNNILLLQANLALLEESYLNTQRQAIQAEASFRAGLAPRLVWLQAQVAVENMRPAVNDLRNNLESLTGNFALLLGLPYDTLFSLQPIAFGTSAIPGDTAALISQAAAGKPDIRELRAAIVAQQSQRKALRLQHFTPFLRLSWVTSSMFNPQLDPFTDNLFSGDNWQPGGQFALTLGMNLNSLFPFTKEGQQRRELDDSLRIQNIRLAQAIQETELEIFTTINSLERIRVTTEVQQATVFLAEESFRLSEEAFRAGLQDFMAVQNAALALDQARLRVLTEQFNYLNYLIDLEYSLGIPFGTLSSSGTSSSGTSNN